MSKLLKEFGGFLKAWDNDRLKPLEAKVKNNLFDFDKRLRLLEKKFEERNLFWDETQINTEDELKLLIKLLELLRDK
jgi:hypothetical protein